MSKVLLITSPGYYNDLELPLKFDAIGHEFHLTSDGQVTDTTKGIWVPTRLSVDLGTGACYLDLQSLDSPFVGEMIPGVIHYGLPEIVKALHKKNKLF
jgi:hypothetical protein